MSPDQKLNWEYLSITKKRCWKTWLAFSITIIAITIIQTLSGRLQHIVTFSWTWTVLNLLPGFLLVFIGFLLDKETSKMIPQKAHRILWLGSFFYLFIFLITILIEDLAAFKEKSYYEYRLQSLWWLTPIQFTLIVGYLLIFFRRESTIKIGDEELRKIAFQKALHWEQYPDSQKKELFDLIIKSKISKTFIKIKGLIKEKNSGNLINILVLESQFNKVETDFNLNIITYEEYQRIRNRIIHALIELIDNL